MELPKKDLEKLFPNLLEEIETDRMGTEINSVRLDSEEGEITASQEAAEHDPDVIDYLRRCETQQEAKEIIDFLETREEISKEYASELREQLFSQGLRSLGDRKEHNSYRKRMQSDSGSSSH